MQFITPLFRKHLLIINKTHESAFDNILQTNTTNSQPFLILHPPISFPLNYKIRTLLSFFGC